MIASFAHFLRSAVDPWCSFNQRPVRQLHCGTPFVGLQHFWRSKRREKI